MKKHISKSLAAAFLSLFGLNSNVVGMDNPKPKVDYKITGIKYLNDKEDSTSKLGGQAITYSDPLNILVINGLDQKGSNDFEAKSLVSLICHNKFGLKVSDISEDVINGYKEGKVYHIKDQNDKKNVRIVFFNVDNFNNKDFMGENYDASFITKNTNIVLYLFGKRNAGDCCEKLKDFYHEFNRWWCKDYYDYKKDYKPNSLIKRDDWFRYVLEKMNVNDANHRYMYFLYYGTRDESSNFLNCKCNRNVEEFEPHRSGCKAPLMEFVGGMPDGRSITGGIFFKDASINALRDEIFEYGHYHPYKRFNDNLVQGNFFNIFDKTHGTGFDDEKKNVQSGKSWLGY